MSQKLKRQGVQVPENQVAGSESLESLRYMLPEAHHHMATDTQNLLYIGPWVSRNSWDPALKVSDEQGLRESHSLMTHRTSYLG